MFVRRGFTANFKWIEGKLCVIVIQVKLKTSITLIQHGLLFSQSEHVGGMVTSWLVRPVSRSSGWGSIPGWGHCAVFLGKTLHSHSASLHPGL